MCLCVYVYVHTPTHCVAEHTAMLDPQQCDVPTHDAALGHMVPNGIRHILPLPHAIALPTYVPQSLLPDTHASSNKHLLAEPNPFPSMQYNAIHHISM